MVAVGELDKQQVMIDVPQQRSGPEAPGFVVQVGSWNFFCVSVCVCGWVGGAGGLGGGLGLGGEESGGWT
jgi:hypothetical protein